MKNIILILTLAAGWLACGVNVAAQEALRPDGFPSDWKDEDFLAAGGGAPAPLRQVEQTSNSLISNMGTPLGVGAKRGADGMPAGGLSGFGPLPEGALVGGNVWQKAARHVHEEALKAADLSGLAVGPYKSAVLVEGWRRLLLTQADAPVQMDKMLRKNWLAVRAEALEHLGLHGAAWMLWRQTDAVAREQDEALAKGWARGALLHGQSAEACKLARDKVSGSAAVADVFWPAMVAACVGVEKKGEGLQSSLALGLQVLPEGVAGVDHELLPVLAALRDGKGWNGALVEKFGPLSAAVLLAKPQLLASATALPQLPDAALRRLVMVSASFPVALVSEAVVRGRVAPLAVVISPTWPEVSDTLPADATWRRLLELEVQVKNIPGVLALVSGRVAGAKVVSGSEVAAGVLALREVGMGDIAQGLWQESKGWAKVAVPAVLVSGTQVKSGTAAKPVAVGDKIVKPVKPKVPQVKKPVMKKKDA